MNTSKIIQAGKIASQVRDFIRPQIKPGIPLLEIAEKIENKIIELGGKPAFPTNLSINNIAAHYTPTHNDETKAHGLLKIDLGVHINGWIADTAFSIDLENSDENKKLILASEKALENVIKISKENVSTNEIGQTVHDTIESLGFSSVMNLGGHGLDKYDFHSEPFIPNIDNKRGTPLKKGLYAIEPFATTGTGKVHDGKPSGIYQLIDNKNTRSPLARKVLQYIIDEYKTLPFCSRWIVKKFSPTALFALRQLEQNGNLHQFPQLIESQNAIVSQAEHTILIDSDGVKVTTK
ncbi:MAG: type II methionyl aminopeptidase [archaeon]